MQYYFKKWCIVIFQFIKNNNGKYYIGNLISVQNVHCVAYYPFLLRSNSGRKVFITVLKNEILFKKFRFLEGIIKMLPHQHMTEKEHLIVCLRVINRYHCAAFNKININLHFL